MPRDDGFDGIMSETSRIRKHTDNVSGLDMQYHRDPEFCKDVKDFFKGNPRRQVVNAQLKRGDDALGDTLHHIATTYPDPETAQKANALYKKFRKLQQSAPDVQKSKDI